MGMFPYWIHCNRILDMYLYKENYANTFHSPNSFIFEFMPRELISPASNRVTGLFYNLKQYRCKTNH